MINNSEFLLKEIPYFHAISQHYDRVQFWREQKRKCIEGYWVGGKWMPGILYYYINFHKIRFEDASGLSRSIGLPWLRDIEWEKAYIYEEACGFSGFELDTEYTCDRKYGPEKEKALKYGFILEKDLKDKKYMPVREYLNRSFLKNMGKPLYQNEAKNVIDMEARGGGKSYWASACILHNFLFDAATDYDYYLARKQEGNPLTSETLVGAIDQKYSTDLLNKVKLAYENLADKQIHKVGKEDKIFPSPLFVSHTGSFAPSRAVESASKSLIHHRTFEDNPLAANGTRPNKAFLEEVGFMNNIVEAWGAIEATQASAEFKRLVIYALGTGGLTNAGTALYTQEIFYNPEGFNCLVFEDLWESRGKIGYFLPAYMTLNKFKKTENFITDTKNAITYLEDERIRSKKASNLKYQLELINRPIKPSEVFLTQDGNFFPTVELKERLAEVLSNPKILDTTLKGRLQMDENAVLKWVNTDDEPIRDFPVKQHLNRNGSIEIFEHPPYEDYRAIPYGRYLAGIDPYDDDTSTTDSFGCTLIMDSLTNRIVAEYTGRPKTAKEYYENVRRLLRYYNALANYENNKKGLFQYFEYKNCLYLLSPTLQFLKDQNIVKNVLMGNTSYGTCASESVNKYARELIKTWLLEQAYDRPEGVTNLNLIKSPALLKELISWHVKINNADRISALGMLMLIKEDRAKIDIDVESKRVKTKAVDAFFKRLNPNISRNPIY